MFKCMGWHGESTGPARSEGGRLGKAWEYFSDYNARQSKARSWVSGAAWDREVTLVSQTALWMWAGREWLWTAGASLAQPKDLYTEERESWKSQYSRTEPSKSEQTSALDIKPLKI